MSEVISAAVTALSAKVPSFDGVANVIPGEGAIMIDSAGKCAPPMRPPM